MVGGAHRSLKVFLCHASGDKPLVREFYKRLISEGVDAWLDQEKLLPGQDWRVEIPRAVEEADVVIVILSRKSITKEGYVQKEIKFALDIAEEKPEGTIFLIPARIEECSVPERLSRWQWVDLYEENGYAKLLRSLKLRADKTGAVIEPASYVDTDREREHRLDQLYTEGLAAFWVEDWDKACQRFQIILRERPNHAGAAEKLEEAERQRDLAVLYTQSVDAVRSENWQVAIKTLDELCQKSTDYKDVAQLLKNARKQRQLKELYSEAKTLHAAQKWQAVVKVFGQIAVIEPAYPDPDGLLPSAQKEVIELNRLAQLHDLYSHAVREMDVGQWIAARNLLEEIHKSQVGFLETERLLRKVENEIKRIEEEQKRSSEIHALYDQAHGFMRLHQWHKALAKLEEIRRLDDQFPDIDGIADKSKAELAREEEESQHQQELSMMYAEAVRLLKEAKFQAALEKWNEVQSIDPKYKDTARVKSIAKRELDRLVRPAVPQRAWTFSGGISIRWSILMAALGFGLARLLQQNLGLLLQVEISRDPGWFIRGAIHGIILVLVLQRTIQEWKWKALLVFAAGSGVVYFLTSWLILDLSTRILTTFGLSLASILPILITSELYKSAMQWRTLALISAGWMLAWTIGQGVAVYLQGAIPWVITDPVQWATIRWAISDTLAGGLGLWITLDVLKTDSIPVSTAVESTADSQPIQRPERILLLAFLGTVTIRAIWGVFQNWLHIWDAPAPSVLQFTFLFVLGGCYGAVAAFSVKRIIPNWGWKHSITVIAGWSLGLGTAILSGLIGLQFIGPVMILCGLSVAGAMKWAKPSLSPLKVTLIFVSWALAWKYGNMLGVSLVDFFKTDYAWCAGDAITILLGLVATFGIYEYSSPRPTKRTISSFLGFALPIIAILIITNPTVYDGFGNPFYNDSYNKSVWRMEASESRNAVSQQNGSIILTSHGYQSNTFLNSVKYSSAMLTAPAFMEASFRLEPNQNGNVGILVYLDGRDDFVICHIWGVNGLQSMSCQALNFFLPVDFRSIEIVPGTWHKARIEIDPSVPRFTFHIDDSYAGEFIPPQADSYKSVRYTFTLLSGCDGDACNDRSTSRIIEGFFDFVKIGPVP